MTARDQVLSMWLYIHTRYGHAAMRECGKVPPGQPCPLHPVACPFQPAKEG